MTVHHMADYRVSDTAKESDKAFETAIDLGALSSNRAHHNWAGNYMYMGVVNSLLAFKHIDTRQYLYV